MKSAEIRKMIVLLKELVIFFEKLVIDIERKEFADNLHVWVRGTGGVPNSYHAALSFRCEIIRQLWRAVKTTQGQAKRDGLHACPKCRWRQYEVWARHNHAG